MHVLSLNQSLGLGQYVSDTCCETFCVIQMYKLVGPVRVGIWSQYTGHHKLGFRELATEHAHKWDGSAFAQ